MTCDRLAIGLIVTFFMSIALMGMGFIDPPAPPQVATEAKKQVATDELQAQRRKDAEWCLAQAATMDNSDLLRVRTEQCWNTFFKTYEPEFYFMRRH